MLDHPNPHLYFSAPVVRIPIPPTTTTGASISPTAATATAKGPPLIPAAGTDPSFQLLPSVRTALRSSAAAYFTQKRLTETAKKCAEKNVPYRLDDPAATLLPHLQVFTMRFEADWLMKDVGYHHAPTTLGPIEGGGRKGGCRDGGPPRKKAAVPAVGHARSLRQEGFLDGEMCAQSLAEWTGYVPTDDHDVNNSNRAMAGEESLREETPLQFQLSFIIHLTNVLNNTLIPMLTSSINQGAPVWTGPPSAAFSTAATGLSPTVEAILEAVPPPPNYRPNPNTVITVKQRFSGQQETAIYLTIAALRTVAAFVNLWSLAQRVSGVPLYPRSGRDHLSLVVGVVAAQCLFPFFLFNKECERADEFDSKADAIARAFLAVDKGSITNLLGPLLRSLLKVTTFGLEYVNARRLLKDPSNAISHSTSSIKQNTNVTEAMLNRADFIVWTLSPAAVLAMLVRHSAMMTLFALSSSGEGAWTSKGASIEEGTTNNTPTSGMARGDKGGCAALAAAMGSSSSRILADTLFSYHWTALFPVGISAVSPPALVSLPITPANYAASNMSFAEQIASAASLTAAKTTKKHHPLFAPLMFDNYRRISILTARVLSFLVEGCKNRLVVAVEPPVLAPACIAVGSVPANYFPPTLATASSIGTFPSSRLAPGSMSSQSHTAGFALLTIHEAFVAALEMQCSSTADGNNDHVDSHIKNVSSAMMEYTVDTGFASPPSSSQTTSDNNELYLLRSSTTSRNILCWDSRFDDPSPHGDTHQRSGGGNPSAISDELHQFSSLLSGTYRCLLLQELMRVVASVGEFSSYARLPESAALLFGTCLDAYCLVGDNGGTAEKQQERRTRALLRSYLSNNVGLKELSESLQLKASTNINKKGGGGGSSSSTVDINGGVGGGGASASTPLAYVSDSEYLVGCDFLHMVLITLYKTRGVGGAAQSSSFLGPASQLTGNRSFVGVGGRPPTLSSTLPLLSAPGAGSLAQFSSDASSKKSTIRLALDIIHGGVVVGGRMSGGGTKEEDKRRRPMILTPGTGRLLSLLAREAPWALNYTQRRGARSAAAVHSLLCPDEHHSTSAASSKRNHSAWDALLDATQRTIMATLQFHRHHGTIQQKPPTPIPKTSWAKTAVKTADKPVRVANTPTEAIPSPTAPEVNHVGMNILAAVEGMNALLVLCQKNYESITDFVEMISSPHPSRGAGTSSSVVSDITSVRSTTAMTGGRSSTVPTVTTTRPHHHIDPHPTTAHPDDHINDNDDDVHSNASWDLDSSSNDSDNHQDEDLLAVDDAAWLAERKYKKELESILRAAHRIKDVLTLIVFPILYNWLNQGGIESSATATSPEHAMSYSTSIVVTALRFLPLTCVPVVGVTPPPPAASSSTSTSSTIQYNANNTTFTFSDGSCCSSDNVSAASSWEGLCDIKEVMWPLFQEASRIVLQVSKSYDRCLCGIAAADAITPTTPATSTGGNSKNKKQGKNKNVDISNSTTLSKDAAPAVTITCSQLLSGWFPVWSEIWPVLDFFLIETARQHEIRTLHSSDVSPASSTTTTNYGDGLWQVAVDMLSHTLTPSPEVAFKHVPTSASNTTQESQMIARCVLPVLRSKATSTFSLVTERVHVMESTYTAHITAIGSELQAEQAWLDTTAAGLEREKASVAVKERVWHRDQLKRVKPGTSVGPCTDRHIVLAKKAVEGKEGNIAIMRDNVAKRMGYLNTLREMPLLGGSSNGSGRVLLVSETGLQQLIDISVFLSAMYNYCTLAQQVGTLFNSNAIAARDAAIYVTNLFTPSPLPPDYIPLGDVSLLRAHGDDQFSVGVSEGPEVLPIDYAAIYSDSVFKRHIPHYLNHAQYTAAGGSSTVTGGRPQTKVGGGGPTTAASKQHDESATATSNPVMPLLFGPTYNRSVAKRLRIMMQTYVRTAWLMCVPCAAHVATPSPAASSLTPTRNHVDVTPAPIRTLYPLCVGICTSVPMVKATDVYTTGSMVYYAKKAALQEVTRKAASAYHKQHQQQVTPMVGGSLTAITSSVRWEPLDCASDSANRGDPLELILHTVNAVAQVGLRGLALLSSVVPVDDLIAMLPTADPSYADGVVQAGAIDQEYAQIPIDKVASMVTATAASKLNACRIYISASSSSPTSSASAAAPISAPAPSGNQSVYSAKSGLEFRGGELEEEEEDWVNEGLTAFMINMAAKGMVGDRLRRECTRTFPDTASTVIADATATTLSTQDDTSQSVASSSRWGGSAKPPSVVPGGSVSAKQARHQAWLTRKERGVGVVVPTAQLQQRFTIEGLLSGWQRITPLYVRLMSIDALGIMLSRRDIYITDAQASRMAIKCLLVTLDASVTAIASDGYLQIAQQKAHWTTLQHCAACLLGIHQECLEVVSDKKFAIIMAARNAQLQQHQSAGGAIGASRTQSGMALPLSPKKVQTHFDDLPVGPSSISTTMDEQNPADVPSQSADVSVSTSSPYAGIPLVHRPASLGVVINVMCEALSALLLATQRHPIRPTGGAGGTGNGGVVSSEMRIIRIEAQRQVEVMEMLGRGLRRWMGVSMGSREVQAVAHYHQGTTAHSYFSK